VAKKKSNLSDSVVIYFSQEDNCWIAHGLRTDQIGTGDRIVDALAEVLRAIQAIHEEALKDGSLAVYRDAPKEIRDMFKAAKKLPGEIYEVAHKMAHGLWPEDWNPPEPKNAESFRTELTPA
jgi:endonuclease YncB( thermonuclease family)